MDANTFERKLLEMVFETDLPLERGRVAHQLSIPLEEADSQLDALCSRGIIELDSDEHGNLFYVYPNRPPPAPAGQRAMLGQASDIADRAARAAHRAVTALVERDGHAAGPPVVLDGDPEPMSRPIAALASIIPGGGHLARRQIGLGLLWMVAVAGTYVAFWPAGIALHTACALNAAELLPPKKKRR